MTGSERAEGNRSIPTWANRGNIAPVYETVILPEEHYYLRRRIKKRYRFRPRWNLLSLFLLFLIGYFTVTLIQFAVSGAAYYGEKREREARLDQLSKQQEWMYLEKARRMSDDYISEQARKQGLIREGEQLIIMAQPLQEDEAIPVPRKKKPIVIEN
ncbi:MAG TPA: hypothetical protein GX391_07365 [Firmicutes bacterium]|jgi:cell division protein FtsB|nr:hypothetical protein [Bacillota bacterium]HOQ23514.1 septum formation initiator family protein [Bacillota bacterium]HPT68410.1 septum formation initiator family protein [Bacillota bacterium]